MSNQNTNKQSQTIMKQKLLKILSQKNNQVIIQQKQHSNLDNYSLQRKLSMPSHKLPVEIYKSESEMHLFEMLNNQNLTQKVQQLKQIQARTTKLITNYRNKEIKWNIKRDALQKEVDLLRQLLYQY